MGKRNKFLCMNWKNNFVAGKELVLATASKKGLPNANIAVSLGFVDGKLLMADCEMRRTRKNLSENKNICVVGGHYRIKGKVKTFESGKYFDICVKKSHGYVVKKAVVIDVGEVFDLYEGETVKDV